MGKTIALLLVCTLVGAAVALNDGLALVPPMGWNTWCSLGQCARDYCNEKEIMDIADTMVANGMRDLGYHYINLDDCWADYRDEDGNIVPDYSRFPNGMAHVAKYLARKGFKFGLYTDSGIYTCSNGLRDHKIPGSYGHYEQDARSYAEWGIGYVKMDWCNTKVDGVQLDPHECYRNMSLALKATNAPILFNSCEWGQEDPWDWMYKYAHTWRSGPDHHDNWESTSSIIELNAGLGVFSGPTRGYNDLDFLMTGGQGCPIPINYTHCPGQTDDEYKTEFTLWCLMGSSLLVASDIRNMTDIMQEVLYNKELIAINQDPMGAPGIRIALDQTCDENSGQIWVKDLHDESKAVVLYNAGEASADISLNMKLHLGFDNAVTIRDLWNHQYVSSSHGNIHTATVPPHGVAAYKIAKA